MKRVPFYKRMDKLFRNGKNNRNQANIDTENQSVLIVGSFVQPQATISSLTKNNNNKKDISKHWN